MPYEVLSKKIYIDDACDDFDAEGGLCHLLASAACRETYKELHDIRERNHGKDIEIRVYIAMGRDMTPSLLCEPEPQADNQMMKHIIS